MSIIVKKRADGLYEAKATPPHANAPWSAAAPLPARQLIEELQRAGCHQRDIADALHEADPNWLENSKQARK